MDWSQEAAEKAFSLYLEASKKGYIMDNHDSYAWYKEREVQEFIRKIIEPKGKVNFFLDEENDVLQMVPDIDNNTMSYTNEDLRRELNFKDNKELFLFNFIFMILIAELEQPYNSELANRVYIPIDELYNKTNQYIERYVELGEEKLENISNIYKVNVVDIVEAWQRMAVFREGATNHTSTRDNHRMYIEKTIKFLEKEKLIWNREGQNITSTNKLKTIISRYYNSVTNKSRILSLIHDTQKNTINIEEE